MNSSATAIRLMPLSKCPSETEIVCVWVGLHKYISPLNKKSKKLEKELICISNKKYKTKAIAALRNPKASKQNEVKISPKA